MAPVQVEGGELQEASGELRPLHIRVSPLVSGTESLARGIKRPWCEEIDLFLKKTYEMLERCPPELASWSDDGESFVVKQPAVFAERVLPAYFNQYKFFFFEQQLQLYGFQTMRVASTLQDKTPPHEGEDASGKDWWEFRHERFVRGRKDLLGDIRRLSPTETKSTFAMGAVSPIVRVELEKLQTEVVTLREEMQKMQQSNQELTRLMQNLLQRLSDPETVGHKQASRQEYTTTRGLNSPSLASQPRSLPSITLPSPTSSTNNTGPQLALLQLRQGVQSQTSSVTPRTPATGTFQLRPLQSLMANLSPSSRPTPSPRPYVGTPSYSQQLERNQSRNSFTLPSPTATRSPLKRLRADTCTPVSEPQTSVGLRSPEDIAVRELSRIASEIRSDLLACITARVTGFLRVHCSQSEPSPEADADAVAEAVSSDICQKLALLQASTKTMDPILLDAETTCMYRVEILKFISRELPRAVQEAIDKRLPAPEKLKQRPAKDRSLLALLVQKAQKVLECQMRSETAVGKR